jgi:predicted PurR-regulated permease PerM
MEANRGSMRATVEVALAAVLLLLVWFTADLLLVIFAGFLLAVFLRGLADLLARHSTLSRGWSLVTVVVAICGVLFAAWWFIWPKVAAQIDIMITLLPGTIDSWARSLQTYEWGQWLLRQIPAVETAMFSRANILSSAVKPLHWAAATVIILFIGLFHAAEPGLYERGLLRLLPADRRARAAEILKTLGSTLRWWMAGRVVDMVLVGVLDSITLALLGVPLPLTLGLISGVLTFIPYVGAAIALIPVVLAGLSVSPSLALWAFLAHTGIQVLDGYVVTPLVQRRAVALPPLITIGAQFLMGDLLGFLGLVMATPLAAIVLVLVKMLYLKEAPGIPAD